MCPPLLHFASLFTDKIVVKESQLNRVNRRFLNQRKDERYKRRRGGVHGTTSVVRVGWGRGEGDVMSFSVSKALQA